MLTPLFCSLPRQLISYGPEAVMGSVVTSSAYMRVSSGCKEYQMIEAVERIVNVLNQVVAEFERRGHVQGCLPACAMVARFIPDAKVINGFAVCDFGAFAHSWVRIDDTHFDVAKEINLRLLPAEGTQKVNQGTQKVNQGTQKVNQGGRDFSAEAGISV
mgnify:CR=1 FL=1